ALPPCLRTSAPMRAARASCATTMPSRVVTAWTGGGAVKGREGVCAAAVAVRNSANTRQVRRRGMSSFFTSPCLRGEVDFRVKRGSRVRGVEISTARESLTRLAAEFIVGPRFARTRWPLATLSPLAGRGKNLSCLPVINRVRPHVARGCDAVRHIEEADDGGNVPDVAFRESGATQPFAVALLDAPGRGGELDREVEHRALALVESRHAIIHHHVFAEQ